MNAVSRRSFPQAVPASGLLLLAVTVGVGSGADLGVQGLLLDLDFLTLQLGFALRLGNLGIDGSRLNGALLLLLLDGVGGEPRAFGRCCGSRCVFPWRPC